MPSKSPAQRRLMAAAANNPKFAAKAGVPQAVAKEYAEADKAKAHVQVAHAMLKRRGRHSTGGY